MSLPRFFTRSRKQRSYGSVKIWKLTPSPPTRDRSALTPDLKPLAVDGRTFRFSAFSWAVRPGDGSQDELPSVIQVSAALPNLPLVIWQVG